ncbi:MAG: hypothetical protein EPO36_01495 [Chloroflexota bacterium]|nr:MAG: hypothetical protein EPO36_01495 [Chloroflexota bacterium]
MFGSRHRRPARPVRTTLAAVLAAVVLATSAFGAAPAVTITSVGGQPVVGGAVKEPLSGSVTVAGTSATSAGGGTEMRPLVADAGDSPFVASGQKATFIGAAWGGTAPYDFSWTSPVGSLADGGTGATALLDTAGVASGTYTLTLTVRDAAGATATDGVKVVVAAAATQTLLDETKSDPVLANVGIGNPTLTSYLDFPVVVPAGLSSMTVTATWTNIANDYDLHVVDPNGTEAQGGYSGNGATNLTFQLEVAGAAAPVAGTWTVRMERYLTVTDSVHVVVTGRVLSADPRPTVDGGGPYRFALDATQALDGTVAGGTAPLIAAWDLTDDGVFETPGVDVTAQLDAGRWLGTLKVTDADGLERRQTVSVLVADPARLALDTTPITVIGVADSGINPYHLEFSALAYPDPDVLRLTGGFTRHPSAYIAGYPAESEALPLTLGQGYFPAQDAAVFAGVEQGKLYWIPGTKIIGAVDADNNAASNAAADATPILDDDGHGTGSTSVSTGNRYGYCPTCLLFFVEGLDESIATSYPFVDITSHSFGYVGGAPIGPVVGPNEATREAAERGQTVLFAAGNGIGNAFDVPIATYGSDQTGASWNITVGAIRRDNQRAIVGDGIPVDISAWGDGNLPSACRTGTVGQCAFGGTSAATPYTAGIFGTVLTEVRRAIGDGIAGQRPGQVVAEGVAIPGSVYLDDGRLTRSELRDAVLKTAFPLNQDNQPSTYPFPMTAPYLTPETNMLFEGYGAATPEGAKRAVDVILGRALVPDRSFEDQFNALDQAVKDTLYGGYDRDGDGDVDFQGFVDPTVTLESVGTLEGSLAALRVAAEKLGVVEALSVPAGQTAQTWYLHRQFSAEPGTAVSCIADDNESFMDTSDSAGDLECFENRVTSVPAAFRPLGIYPASVTLDAPLPAGSDVYATLYVTSATPTVGRASGTLMATDREIGAGMSPLQPMLGFGTGDGSNVQGQPLPDGGGCETVGELCWTKFDLAFETTRPAFTGEHLTFQISLLGVREYAFGHEGRHASKVAIVAAPMPPSGLDFGVTVDSPAAGSSSPSGSTIVAGGQVAFPDLGSDPTGAGDHPSRRAVEVSIDDASFGAPQQATWDADSGTWSFTLGTLADGQHTVHVRARIDTTYSAVASSTFRVAPDARVEWQIVRRNGAPHGDDWHTADGLASWSFGFATSAYGNGNWTIVVRLVEDSLEVARSTASARFR